MSLNDTTHDVPYGYCHCGCGKRTNIAKRTNKARGRIKGQPYLFLKGHNRPHSIERFWENINKHGTGGCWIWTGFTNKFGYGRFHISANRNIATHRYSYELHNGPVPKGMCVLHTCDRPQCCNPAHLWLGTRDDNMKDMARKKRGRESRGVANTKAKLTEIQVSEIRRRYASNPIPHKVLAAEYGVSRSTISFIVTRRSWSHIP